MLLKLRTWPSFVGSVVALLGAGAASRSATSRRAIARLGLAADKADAPATSEEDGDWEDWADWADRGADANGPACDTMWYHLPRGCTCSTLLTIL